MALIDDLIRKVNQLGDLNLDPGEWTIRRTYAGRHQRSRGAWSWQLWPATGVPASSVSIGSIWPATLCAKEATELYKHPYTGDLFLEVPPHLYRTK